MKQKWIGILALTLLIPLYANSSNNSPEPYVPGLGDMMGAIQMRHAKLWFAGKNENWSLASYELDELKEGFNDATMYHPIFKGKAIADLLKIYPVPALDQVEKAIKQKNPVQFANAFDRLSKACTKCHETTGYDFIMIERPNHPQFTNQRFKP